METKGSPPGVLAALHVDCGEPGGRVHPFSSDKRKVAFNYAQGGEEIVIQIHVADCEMKCRLLNCSVAKTWTSGCTGLR